jgi:hypothetical protein
MSTEILKSKETYDQAVQQFLKLSQEVLIYLSRGNRFDVEFRIPIYVVLFFLNKQRIVFLIIVHLLYENMHFIWLLPGIVI